ncbi:MAG TPA: HepT-like ribonuclease domain-containing protein [Pelobium sp.]|nr:HepT-like ribonuclease domain-containing protein [Pelobium sp.]
MDIKELKLLKDILDCINHIDSYIGNNKVFEIYENNPLLQDAVERNIITIGEAMNALLKLNPKIKITNARRIVDARNKLTHGYDEIEIVQIWSIIIKHLPTLKAEVCSFLTS